MTPNAIHFHFNQPVILKIADPDPDCEHYDDELRIGRYQTVDGRAFSLPRPAVVKLLELAPAPGEQIGICKREAEKGSVIWDMWLTSPTEQVRANQETSLELSDVPSDTELLLEASLKRGKNRKQRNGHPTPIRKPTAPATEPAQPRLFDQGTGTDGPAPQLAPASPGPRPAIAAKTPYGDMLRHIVQTVESVLKSEGVQLGDGPKQDLYSTVYISACKQVGVVYDFTAKVE